MNANELNALTLSPEQEKERLAAMFEGLLDLHGTNRFFDSLAIALRRQGRDREAGPRQLFESAARVMTTTRRILDPLPLAQR